MTDEKIMELIKEGETRQIAVLFDRYHIPLYNFFINRKIEATQSEDLTQNVFEKIIKYAHSFNSTYQFRPWIYRIARNILNDHFSKTIKIQELEPSKISLVTSTIEAQIEAEEKLSQLRRAMNLLDQEDRDLIEWSRFQKLKYHEIGELLNLSEGAVKTRMYRAMKKLKTNYLKLENE